MKIIKGILAIDLLVLLVCMCFGDETLILEDDDLDAMYAKCGREFMALKNVPEGDERVAVSSWTFPTSIVAKGVVYDVVRESGFKVFLAGSRTNTVAVGDVSCMANAKIARFCGFGELGMNSLGLRDYVPSTFVSFYDSKTNTIFVTEGVRPNDRAVLIYKNLYVEMRSAVTNTLGIAAAILNAGLPEGERFVLPE